MAIGALNGSRIGIVVHSTVRLSTMLMCVVAMGIGASIASGQYLEAVIRLPDTLGPLNGPYHLAWDENPAHPRLYIGGEADSGGVIVAEAITCKRLARVSTGPVKALCLVPPERKLYVASLNSDTVLVVDCATDRVTASVPTAGIVSVMQYNAQNDRLYCGGDSITVIDCAGDTVVHTIAVAATSFAYDSAANKLYAGRNGPLTVIDCSTDSVVVSLSEVSRATALCLNPTAAKVYAATVDTLFAVRTDGDSVVARLPFDSLGPLLACDPQRNRMYCTWSHRDWGHWVSIDCSSDTVLLTRLTDVPLTFLACNTARDLLFIFPRSWYDEVDMYDASTGQFLTRARLDGIPPGGGWSPGLDRLYGLPMVYPEDLGYSCCLLSAIDGTGDSIAGIVPLTVKAENIVLDTVHNRLYFTYGSTACGCVGIVDCSRNIVTGYLYGGQSAGAVCYNPNNDRLYWNWSTAAWGGQGSSMIAYDCSTGTVAGKITTSGGVRASRLNLSLNKLYAYIRDTLGNYVIDVIGERDSVIKVVDTPYESFWELLLVPEDNTLWCLGVWSVVVIDCLSDSVVYAASDTLGSINDACACPEDRRIYTGGEGNTVRSVNMDKPAEVDTLHERIPESGKMSFLNIPGAHKAYWSYAYPSHWPGSSRVFAIDTRTSTLVDSFWVGQMIADMCLDHTGNFVYCAAMSDSALLVIDARGDSVVATVRLPPATMEAEKNSLVLNRATGRLYEAQTDVYRYGDVIPVIRDSMLTGLEELKTTSPPRFVAPTLLSRSLPMIAPTPTDLFDASGRRAEVLKRGPNDISHLTPGVYFLRGPGTDDGRPGVVRKVIITR